MDLHTVTEVCGLEVHQDWRPGDAWLAGGTWLFSEPQPRIRRLVDLSRAGWRPISERPDGSLEIAATATIAQLAEYPHPLFEQCALALLASFKIWHVATVGGNLCNALPAGPMISLTAALAGECLLISPNGARRVLPVDELVTGDGCTALGEGELLRWIRLPARALTWRTAMRQASLHELGRSAALVIGTRDPVDSSVTVCVTASTVRPYLLRFPAPPTPGELRAAIEHAVPAPAWFDDVHGDPRWRRHLTFRLAEQVRDELAAPC